MRGWGDSANHYSYPHYYYPYTFNHNFYYRINHHFYHRINHHFYHRLNHQTTNIYIPLSTNQTGGNNDPHLPPE